MPSGINEGGNASGGIWCIVCGDEYNIVKGDGPGHATELELKSIGGGAMGEGGKALGTEAQETGYDAL